MYIIIEQGQEPFATAYYDYENHYRAGMMVIDLHKTRYTTNGIEWKKLELDHL